MSLVGKAKTEKALSSLINMLDPNTDDEFILRLTMVMDNLTYTVEQMKLDPSQLPKEKAPSPETYMLPFTV
ncbi:hypothetical protein CHUAL_009500 [Chamberlinius hualienensis]